MTRSDPTIGLSSYQIIYREESEFDGDEAGKFVAFSTPLCSNRNLDVATARPSTRLDVVCFLVYDCVVSGLRDETSRYFYRDLPIARHR